MKTKRILIYSTSLLLFIAMISPISASSLKNSVSSSDYSLIVNAVSEEISNNLPALYEEAKTSTEASTGVIQKTARNFINSDNLSSQEVSVISSYSLDTTSLINEKSANESLKATTTISKITDVYSAAAAGSGSTTNNSSDSSYTYYSSVTIYYDWRSYNGTGATEYLLTAVSTSYSGGGSGVTVVSQTLRYGCSDIMTYQAGVKYPSGTSSSYYTGFSTYVLLIGGYGELNARYTLTLKRQGAPWDFTNMAQL